MNPNRTLDAEVASLLSTSPIGAFDWTTFEIAMLPAFRKAMSQASTSAHLAGVVYQDLRSPAGTDGQEVVVRHYLPADSRGGPRPCLFWIHGGGYMMGNHLIDEPLVEQWTADLQCSILSVDYRLAPEHPYPAPIDDCYHAFAWAAANADDLGIDAERLVVGGTSAGAGLAAAVTLLARDRGGPPIAHQLLIYPMLDDRPGRYPSSRIETSIWGQRANDVAWGAYLGAHSDGDVSPYAAPSRATDLSELPPALILACGVDVLRDEAIDYAGRLMQAGVDAELHVYPGVPHVFDVIAPDASVSRRFRRDITEALDRGFQSPPRS